MELRKIGIENIGEIKKIILDAFSAPPWNDVWEDDILTLYIHDIVGNANSLTLGMYDGDKLAGLAQGRLKHWYYGIEYCIDDLCIASPYQGQGIGGTLIKLIREYSARNGFHEISLRTNRHSNAYSFYKKNGFDEIDEKVFFSMNLE